MAPLGAVVLVLTAAGGCSLLATAVVRSVAIRRGWVDLPDGHLHPHGRPIPRLGGLAIFLGMLAGAAVGLLIGVVEATRLIVALGIGALVFALGLMDDLRGLNPYLRLGGQLLAGLILALAGFRFGLFSWPPLVAILVSVLLVAGTINALNLLDGMDGLAAGVAAISALGFVLLFISQRSYGVGLILAVALLGGVLGFLPYNVSPASIFMGDGGSTVLGLGLAILALEASRVEPTARNLAAALVLLGVPAWDTTLAIVRRLIHRKPLFVGDRSHFYDRLASRGLSVQATVAVGYGLAWGCVVLSQGLLRLPALGIGMISLLVVVVLVGGTLKLGLLRT